MSGCCCPQGMVQMCKCMAMRVACNEDPHDIAGTGAIKRGGELLVLNPNLI